MKIDGQIKIGLNAETEPNGKVKARANCEAEIRAVLQSWVLETSATHFRTRRGASGPSTSRRSARISNDTPLFADGLLKSVHVMELILLIEELSGRQIDVDRLGPEAFKSIDTIWSNFFTNTGGYHADGC